MARIESDPNYTTPTFSRATASADIFKKEDVQQVAAALSTHIHDGSGKGLVVSTAGFAVGSIAGAAIADGGITSAKIADGTIATGDLADGAVTSAKIADGTIAAADMSAALGNFGAGTAWTPAITQGGSSPTFTGSASFIQIGKMVLVSMQLSVTSAGSAGADIIISSLPVAPRGAGGYLTIGNFVYVRAGTGIYAGSVVATSSALAKMVAGGSDGTTNLSAFLGNTGGPSFAMANGDTISFSLHYEAA